MTSLRPGRSTERKALGAGWGVVDLRKRPGPPAAAAATVKSMWPMSQDLLPFSVVDRGLDYDYQATDLTSPGSTSFNTATLDTTYLNGFYFTKNTNVDHANFLQYVRLGPKGSVWGVIGVAEAGPDCGKLTFGWQTISEDAAATFYLSGVGFLPGSTDRPTELTFYTGNTPTVDLYAGVQKKMSTFSVFSQFRIAGDDGAPVTANATTQVNNNGYKKLDGGAGIWVLRAWVNGKNASSSGYKVRLSELRVQRFTSDGFPTG